MNTITKYYDVILGDGGEPDESTPVLDGDITVEEFYSGFNLDFLSEEERQTIYTATELYAKGKVRQASQPQPKDEGYWQRRCEAAEKVYEKIIKGGDYGKEYAEWQALKQSQPTVGDNTQTKPQ